MVVKMYDVLLENDKIYLSYKSSGLAINLNMMTYNDLCSIISLLELEKNTREKQRKVEIGGCTNERL